ncbi:hypothetical protein QEN19_004198 [Hanseniaspora menglaensis]
MFQYNPVRDSGPSITTLLPLSNTNYTNNNALFNGNTENLSGSKLHGVGGPDSSISDDTLPKNKDPTSDGNIIITINDYDKLKISYIDIRLNSLYKNMIMIEQQENLMNNNNNMVNISGKAVVSVLKPLVLYKPITMEMKGNFKLDFIEINKNSKNKKLKQENQEDENRMDTVVVKESRLIFYAKWDSLIEKSDGEYVDLCKNKFDRERNLRNNSKRKTNPSANIKGIGSSSLTNILKKAAFISQNISGTGENELGVETLSDVSNAPLSLSPINTHDNVFNMVNTDKVSRPSFNESFSASSITSSKHKATRQVVKVLNPSNPLNHYHHENDNDKYDDSNEYNITKVYMPPGNYEFPFRLTVNEKDLPDTVEGLQTGSLMYTLTLKMHCENYGLVEHVQYIRVFKTLKANNLNLHTGFNFKHDLKVKKKVKANGNLSKKDESTVEARASDSFKAAKAFDNDNYVLTTQLQLDLETPSKAYPLGGSMPLKFQLTPLIKNFEIVKIEISLNQKSLLWDNNNEMYEKDTLIREWTRTTFDNISGIEKQTDGTVTTYRLVNSDIEFLYILPIPNNLKEITQNSIVAEHFYNGSCYDDEYNSYKDLQLPRISNSHSLSVDIFIKQPGSKVERAPLKFSFQLSLILYCSPNVAMEMRKVLLDKFKRIHFRKGEVEPYFTSSLAFTNSKLSNNTSSRSGGGRDNRSLMDSYVQQWFPELQTRNPPPLYNQSQNDDIIESCGSDGMRELQTIDKAITNKNERLKKTKETGVIADKQPPKYSNTHFDFKNIAINVDHYKILKSEKLVKDYYDGLLLGRHHQLEEEQDRTGNQNNKFGEGVLQFDTVTPNYDN